MPLLERTLSLLSHQFRVKGASMEPTFRDGTLVRLSPLPYFLGSPMRGDVVSVKSPKDVSRLELKRILGLPGDHVSWHGSHFWINGILLKEHYVRQYEAPPGDSVEMIALGPGEYFVAGDNRLYSTDSRNYGPVWRSDILARAAMESVSHEPALDAHTPV